jgi:hypothetical protein
MPLRSILPKKTCRLSEKKFMDGQAVSLAWINTWSQIIPNMNVVRTIMLRLALLWRAVAVGY